MKRLLLLLGFFLILSSLSADDTFIDGRKFSEVEVEEFAGISAPSVSASNTARLYFDSTNPKKLKVSEDGGAYSNILNEASADTLYAPITADYLVGTSNPLLMAEIVVGTTPGGELGGTWASPTVDSGVHDDEYVEIVGDVMTGQLEIQDTSNQLKLTDSDDPTNVYVTMGMSDTGSLGQFDINIIPAGNDGATMRYFRLTNTAGTKRVKFAKGNGTDTTDVQIGVDGTDSYFNGGGEVGINVTDPDTPLEILFAGTQLKLSYDASNYFTFTTESDGDLTFDSNKASYDLDLGDGNLITTGDGSFSDISILGDNIEATTETDRFVWMGNGFTYAPEAIDLGTDTTGNYVSAVTDGDTGIDGACSSEDCTYAPSLDTTEIDATTWSDGANASNVYTFDVSGTDHTMTAESAKMAFSNDVDVDNDLTVTGELKGARAQFTCAQRNITAGTTLYVIDDLIFTSAHGWRVLHDGSIVGASLQIIGNSSPTVGTFRVNINDIEQFTVAATFTTASTGNQATYARGTYTFSAGDVINPEISASVGLGDITKFHGVIEVQYND